MEKGFVLWDGPSALTGDPIVVIATLRSDNVKTGNMLQTWILRSDIEPHIAMAAGLDAPICGNCPQRAGNGCYVTVFQAPLSIYRAYRRGVYPRLTTAESLVSLGTNRAIRLGSYGDPAAAPFEVFASLVKRASKHTGYTHQIKHPNFDKRFTTICMVSVETQAQARRYHDRGYRTFRATHDPDHLLPSERRCLSDSVGKTCIECAQCDGGQTKKLSYVVKIHGARPGRFSTDSVRSLIASA